MEIHIRGVSKYYYSEGKTIKALDDVNLTIPANQIFTLLGVCCRRLRNPCCA